MKQKYEDTVREKIEDQNQRLRNCNKVVNETITLGNNTNLELEKQDETLKRIDNNLDNIEEDLSKSKWLMRGIKSTFGMLWNGLTDHRIFGKKKNKDKSKKQDASSAQVVVEKPSPKESGSKPSTVNSSNKGKMFEKELNQQEDLLDELNNNVLLLKGVALSTGQKLDEQNKQLDQINKKVDKNNKTMEGLSKDMRSYIGK